MGRKIFAVITGVIVGFVIIFIGDATVHKLNPLNDSLGEMDKETIEAYVSGTPLYIKVILALFWLLAAFLGGFVAAKIYRAAASQVSLITGGILLAASLLNLAMVTHPLWMWLVALLLIVPCAWFGGRAASPGKS